jgi:hypothetical protein
MLLVASALRKDNIGATDGRIGTVSDFLFDDWTSKLRWLVADSATWLTRRKVLIYSSAIGLIRDGLNELPVAQVKGSPEIATDQPVSRQMESNLGGYYGWDTNRFGGAYLGGYTATMGLPFVSPPVFAPGPGAYNYAPDDTADPHLRSISAISKYKIVATDGPIGHFEEVLIDNGAWTIRDLIVDTRNWWPGKHVLMSPYALSRISRGDGDIEVRLTRELIKSSPPWEPTARIDEAYEKQLHCHYGWPGHGFV